MTNFSVPTREEVSANNQAIFDKLKDSLGMVPNLYATMAYSDTGLENYLGFQNGKTSLNKKEKEVVNLVVSEVNNCRYCQSAHTAIGKMIGFTEEQTLELRSGHALFDQKLDALVKFAKEATLNKGRVNNTTLEKFFHAGYSRESIIDVIIAIADKIVMNYIHNLTQIPIDFPLAKDLAPETAAVEF